MNITITIPLPLYSVFSYMSNLFSGLLRSSSCFITASFGRKWVQKPNASDREPLARLSPPHRPICPLQADNMSPDRTPQAGT